ncbi:MAG: substrate-binding domain-containing protein, partial [Lapillicoccus sp.]
AEGKRRGMRMRHVAGTYEYESGAEETRRLLSAARPSRPTALVVGNDIMATAALRTATELGVAVPEELSIIAWDDSVLCHVARPQLTAMDHGLMEKARLATDLLFEIIAGGTRLHRYSPVGTLLVRETSGPAPR